MNSQSDNKFRFQYPTNDTEDFNDTYSTLKKDWKYGELSITEPKIQIGKQETKISIESVDTIKP